MGLALENEHLIRVTRPESIALRGGWMLMKANNQSSNQINLLHIGI